MKKMVALFDIHVPSNITLDPVFHFIQDFNPDVLVLGGDAHDFPAVCHWIPDQSRHLDGGTVKENFHQLQAVVFDPLKKVLRKDAQRIYLEGNHENWLHTATLQSPDLRGYIELKNNIPKEWKIIPLNVPYRPNQNFVLIHGLYTNLYHARATVQAYHTSVYYGHNHTMQQHMLISPVDRDKFYTGQSIGCLCDLNPSWMKNKPNSWVHGFLFGYLDTDGTFAMFPVVIVRNGFWANGKKY